MIRSKTFENATIERKTEEKSQDTKLSNANFSCLILMQCNYAIDYHAIDYKIMQVTYTTNKKNSYIFICCNLRKAFSNRYTFLKSLTLLCLEDSKFDMATLTHLSIISQNIKYEEGNYIYTNIN